MECLASLLLLMWAIFFFFHLPTHVMWRNRAAFTLWTLRGLTPYPRAFGLWLMKMSSGKSSNFSKNGQAQIQDVIYMLNLLLSHDLPKMILWELWENLVCVLLHRFPTFMRLICTLALYECLRCEICTGPPCRPPSQASESFHAKPSMHEFLMESFLGSSPDSLFSRWRLLRLCAIPTYKGNVEAIQSVSTHSMDEIVVFSRTSWKRKKQVLVFLEITTKFLSHLFLKKKIAYQPKQKEKYLDYPRG